MNIKGETKMTKYMVSACLLGDNCKYNGGNNQCTELLTFLQDKEYVKVCPEQLGGLPTPRLCCEIKQGVVKNELGASCDEAFHEGADKAIAMILEQAVDMVITQPRSPSCGKGLIYDGSFEGKLIEGNGIFAQKLIKLGINVMNVDDFLVNIKRDEGK